MAMTPSEVDEIHRIQWQSAMMLRVSTLEAENKQLRADLAVLMETWRTFHSVVKFIKWTAQAITATGIVFAGIIAFIKWKP